MAPPERGRTCQHPQRYAIVALALGLTSLLGCAAPRPSTAAPTPASASAEPATQKSISTKQQRVDSSRLAGTDPSAAQALLRAADEAFLAGRYAKALDGYRRAKKQSPLSPAAAVGLVRAQLAKAGVPEGVNAAPNDKAAEAAREQLQAIASQHKAYYIAWLELGRICLVLGRATQAKHALERARKLQDNDPEVLSSLGIALLLSGQAETAVGLLKKAAELDPNSASRHANLATVLLQTQRLAAAIISYRRAAALQPNNPQIQTSLGTALLQAGELKMALGHLKKATRLDPTRATGHNNLGFAYLMVKRCKLAQERFKRALELDSKLGSAWINSAICHAKSGDLPAARKALNQALALDAEDPRAHEVDRELRQLEGTGGTKSP